MKAWKLGLGALGLAWGLAAVWGYDVVADVDPSRMSQLPSPGHPLGTDHLGRDVAARLVLATHAFVAPGLTAAAGALALGLPLGALAGSLSGWGRVLRGLWGVLDAIPGLILALLFCLVWGDGPWRLALAVGLSGAASVAEAVRGRVQGLARSDFILAARAHGYGWLDILFRQILWACCRRLALRAGLRVFGTFLALECTLSYLGGFGVPEPTPSWGNMIAFSFGQAGNPLAPWAPALALGATLAALHAASGALEGPDRG